MADDSITREFAKIANNHPDVSGLMAAVGSKYSYIVLAEGNHKNYPDHARIFYGNPSFYEFMNKGGFCHLFLEAPCDFKEIFDAYARRDESYFDVEYPQFIDRDEFADETPMGFVAGIEHSRLVKLQIADTIDRSHEQGISVVPLDKGYEFGVTQSWMTKNIKPFLDVLREKGILREKFMADTLYALDYSPGRSNDLRKYARAADAEKSLDNILISTGKQLLTLETDKIIGDSLSPIQIQRIKKFQLEYSALKPEKNLNPILDMRAPERLTSAENQKVPQTKMPTNPGELMALLEDLKLPSPDERLKAMVHERLRVDEGHWIGIVNQHIVPGQKAVFQVGGFHAGHAIADRLGINHIPGIDELLGGDSKTATIGLASSDKQIEYFLNAEDAPHVVIDMRTDTVIIGEKLGLPGYKPGDRVKIEEFRETPAAPGSAPAIKPPAP